MMTYPRLFVENYWYHVFSRGQRHEPLFFSPMDRVAYLSFLDFELTRRGGKVGSYCLMNNHVHLLIQMEDVSLGKIFQAVHMNYAKYFNKKRGTSGHVFQGRPGMKIVLMDNYLAELVGYIHRNPVKAGIVKNITDFKWSSWRWFLEEAVDELANGILPPGYMGGDRAIRFIETIDKSEKIPEGEAYWGSDEEWKQMDCHKENAGVSEQRVRIAKDSVIEKILIKTKYSYEDMKGRSQARELAKLRREAMARMYEEGYGTTEIGNYFNRTPGAVSHAYMRWKEDQ